MQFTTVAGLSCASAIKVVESCTEDGLPGWDIVVDSSRIVLRSGPKMIVGDMAGGSPPCVSADNANVRTVGFNEGGYYQPVAGAQQRALARAARKGARSFPGVTGQFAWYIGERDPRAAVVCGEVNGAATGLPLVKRSGRWRVSTTSSGALQNAASYCAG